MKEETWLQETKEDIKIKPRNQNPETITPNKHHFQTFEKQRKESHYSLRKKNWIDRKKLTGIEA
jgi:hypothetical protein